MTIQYGGRERWKRFLIASLACHATSVVTTENATRARQAGRNAANTIATTASDTSTYHQHDAVKTSAELGLSPTSALPAKSMPDGGALETVVPRKPHARAAASATIAAPKRTVN